MVHFIQRNPPDKGPDRVSETINQPAEQPAEPVTRPEAKREFFEFVKLVVLFLLVFIVMRTFVMESYVVDGPSMKPTLETNERILVIKLPHLLSKLSLFGYTEAFTPGDIIVMQSPEKDRKYVKRLVAKGPAIPAANTAVAESTLHGSPETISVRYDRGTLYVNNRKVNETYLTREKDASPDDSTDSNTLKPGEYYVLGDNRPISLDSRKFGPVSGDKVVGRAVLCYWPPSKMRLLK